MSACMPERFLLLQCALALCAALVGNPATGQDDEWPGSGPYLRVVDLDDSALRLDLAVRFFSPAEGTGPTIALAGAIHIAEAEFYAVLQRFLDSQDLVLFEGVKPRGVGGVEGADDAVRVRRTEPTIRFLAIALHRHHKTAGAWPATLDELAATAESAGRPQAQWIRSSMRDAWDRPLVYRPAGDGYALISLGADGTEGGEGFDADLAFADQSPLTDAETGADPGLQSQMARALGLAFQLEAMNHDGPNYRNSDLTIDQVQERVAARGGDASILFQILDGSSFMGRAARLLLGMIERNERMRTVTRLVLIETMRSTDIENLGRAPGLPPSMAELMHVIVIDRNKVVIEDLRNVLAQREVPASIAVVYGAGHMSDLERRLVGECGYRHVGGFWIAAMSVHPRSAGLSKVEIDAMRRMIERMQPK